MSSAEVGSSSITKRGSSTSARAMAMRCRWPPGKLVRVAEAAFRVDADLVQGADDACLAFLARQPRARAP
jgi:hypothetical protein